MVPLNKILVRANNFMGDVVMSLPALAALREHYPQAEITVLAPEKVLPLLRCCPRLIDKEMVYDRPFHKTLQGRRELAREIRSRRFDAVILFQKAFESAWIMARAGVPMRVGFSVEGRGWLLTHRIPFHTIQRPVHRILRNLRLLRTIGIDSDRVVFPIDISERAREWGDRWLQERGLVGRKVVLIHPNVSDAGGTARMWPVERFRSLIEGILEREEIADGVVIIGKPSRLDPYRPLLEMEHPRLHSLMGETSLEETMALMERSSLLVSNDSGPVHLAYALRLPVISIFGPKDPVVTGPWGDRSKIVRAPVDCRPCFEDTCPIDHRCMRDIEVRHVLKAAEELIDSCGRVSL